MTNTVFEKMNSITRYSGTVVKGLQNGRAFGFPTANIKLSAGYREPEQGVFAVLVECQGEKYQGMLYVGNRPTIHLSELSIEIHIFDFNKMIYGEHVIFEIVKKIRDEQHFPSIDTLIAQIKKDKDEIVRFFNA